ncbi:MAG: hypothetical protein KIT09_22805 [Bryobacteraceae bacterium]|nr:hypothetical protein [Bryobacteraceae bacterium]
MRTASLARFCGWLLPAAVSLMGAGPDKVVPAINAIDPWRDVGQQPYEMTWAERSQHPQTLVDFEDLQGWTLELFNGAGGELRRSREQQMWGQYVAKIVYSGSGDQSRVVARPPKPIPIPARFDSVELWGHGNRWRWENDPTTPPTDVAVLVVDARGREIRIEVADVRWRSWWLIHRRVAAELLNQVVWPASFSGIEVSKAANKDPRHLYFDSLAFYTETLAPIKIAEQPRRNLKPFRGQIAGTNTGPGTLPFPTREETILPENFEREFKVSARQVQAGHFEWKYEGKDATITYEYRPRTGNLSELSASVNGGTAFQPMAGGGVRFADTPEDRVAEGELVSAALDGGVVRAKFRHGSREVDYELRLWQKSLVLDVWCDGGDAVEMRFGRVAGVTNPKPITVPYVTLGATNPRILMWGDAAKPAFTSVWFDWYRTNASEPFAFAKPEVTASSAQINGGMRYIAKTDAQRNNLHERVFATTSPVYEETFPSIPNPPSLRQDEGKQVVWTVATPETFEKDHERCRRIRSYGLDKIMQHSHEVTWRDHGDSYTMRLNAAPQKGGDQKLKWYIAAQNAMGWLQGVYSNYCDFAPVNTNWDPDRVQRMPNGDWRRAWPRTYAMKPSAAVEMDAYYAQRIKDKFGVKMSYTDVHTDNPPPWEYCDYDARVPGAGTFAATFYAYGQLLLNDQRVYGPTQSESTFQWIFAGLQSGGYGWVYTDINLLTHPLDSAFMLRHIHPLECDYGMGYTNYYLGRLDKQWKESPRRREYVDMFLATTIGYGNMGWLVTDWGLDEPFGVEAMARSYYMMQQLQRLYGFVRPKTIEYADGGGRLLSPSQAHATGAIADSRLRVVYENGLEVFVNRGDKSSWTVKDHRGRSVELPPAGWLAFHPSNGFYELSATVNGARRDYVSSQDYEYLDGRGQWTENGTLGAAGAVARRNKADGVVELIDIYGNGRIRFQAAAPGRMQAYDPEGAALGEVALTAAANGWYEFNPLPNARSYVFASPPQ